MTRNLPASGHSLFLKYFSSQHLIFLRKIKYYKGIIFLTTNRVSNFDEAILSRIYLILKYNELGIKVRG